MHAATLRATAIVLAAGALVVTALEATLLSRYGATWITLGNLGVHVAVTGALAVRHDLPRVSTAVTVIALGYLGAKPPEGVYVWSARAFTAYYFAFFLLIMPFLGVLETPSAMPRSITEAVLGKGASATPAGASAAPEKR